MSRQLSRSSAVQAAFAAVLVIGVLLLLIVSGHNDDQRERDEAEAATQSEGPQKLAGGFTTIPQDQFFATMTKAQKESGGWHQAMAVDENDQTVTLLSEDVWMDGEQPVMRGTTQGPDGPLVALYADDVLYLKGLGGQQKPWWKVPDRPVFESLLAFGDQGLFLESVEGIQDFGVVGAEQVKGSAPDGGSEQVNTVHYTIQVDQPLSDDQGATTVQPVTMDLWLDDRDRPVQVVTTYTAGDVRTETTLLYSQYGSIAPIKAPPAEQVTTKVPADYAAKR
ncbi:hypothetical protein ASG90_10810 [Nocardioides sp. Soil797]|nr:hypothetical protein ASG90_10810 [Nocardioides sp. Soil797]